MERSEDPFVENSYQLEDEFDYISSSESDDSALPTLQMKSSTFSEKLI